MHTSSTLGSSWTTSTGRRHRRTRRGRPGQPAEVLRLLRRHVLPRPTAAPPSPPRRPPACPRPGTCGSRRCPAVRATSGSPAGRRTRPTACGTRPTRGATFTKIAAVDRGRQRSASARRAPGASYPAHLHVAKIDGVRGHLPLRRRRAPPGSGSTTTSTSTAGRVRSSPATRGLRPGLRRHQRPRRDRRQPHGHRPDDVADADADHDPHADADADDADARRPTPTPTPDADADAHVDADGPSRGAARCSYTTTDWNTGFTASVKITNGTSVGDQRLVAQLRLPRRPAGHQPLVGCVHADGLGGHRDQRRVERDDPAGGSVELGFNGSHTGTNPSRRCSR